MGSLSFVGLQGEASDAPGRQPRVAGRFDGKHVIVPLLTDTSPTLTDQLEVATTLASVSDATLSLIRPVAYPSQTSPVRHRDASGEDEAALLEWALDNVGDAGAYTERGLLHTRDLVTRTLRTVRAQNVDTLVLPSGAGVSRLRKGLLDRLAAQADCDVVVVNGQAGYEPVASILLAVAGGPHSGLAADLAGAVATSCDAWVDVLHVVDEGASRRAYRRATALVEKVSYRVGRPDTTSTWILEADRTAEALVEQSRCYDLTILGAPTKSRLRELIYGSTNTAVRGNAQSVVLSVRNNRHRVSDSR